MKIEVHAGPGPQVDGVVTGTDAYGREVTHTFTSDPPRGRIGQDESLRGRSMFDKGPGDDILGQLQGSARRINAYARGRRDERAAVFLGERRSVRRHDWIVPPRDWKELAPVFDDGLTGGTPFALRTLAEDRRRIRQLRRLAPPHEQGIVDELCDKMGVPPSMRPVVSR